MTPDYHQLLDGAMRCVAPPTPVLCDGTTCSQCDRAAWERWVIQQIAAKQAAQRREYAR
jgi:hypothetical protein